MTVRIKMAVLFVLVMALLMISCSAKVALEYKSATGGTCTVTGIGSYKGEELVIPSESSKGERVTKIGASAFEGCTSIASVVIPDSVTMIGKYAFYQCSDLVSVTIPEGVKTLEWGAFDECISLTTIIIPDSVTDIGSYCFAGCTNLTSVTIGKGVQNIEDAVFDKCRNLKDITYNGTKEEWAAIRKNWAWEGYEDLPATVVHCTDGDVGI